MLDTEDEKLLDLLEKSLILFINAKFSQVPFLKKNFLSLGNVSFVKEKMHYCIIVDTASISVTDIAEVLKFHINKTNFALALIHKINGFSCSFTEHQDFLAFFNDEINQFFKVHPIAKEFIEFKPIDFHFIGNHGNAINRLF